MGFNRLKEIAFVISANALTLLLALYYQWSLMEVALVYWWQFTVIALITLIIILRAKSLKNTTKQENNSRFQLLKSKVIAFLTVFLMYGLFIAGYISLLYFGFDGRELDLTVHIGIFVCIAVFFFAQFSSYFKEHRAGIYSVLIDDRRAFTPFFRIIPMIILIILIGMKHEHGVNYSFTEYVIALSVIVVVDILLHLVHVEQCKKLSAERNATS